MPAGVPMIAVPQAAEQFLNADRLVELGVARRIDTDDATPENLRAALIDLVGDAGVADRSARLRAEARNEGGTMRAADLIEALLGRPPPGRPCRVASRVDPARRPGSLPAYA
ncbi:nucleotide disphospho-sugar-binding domain-containing protein [Nocardia sp. NPDC002869]|uniref:nucleotide disphospho-sugar-binding domain-containing protein n=1 Tax=Nocardia sp. NPDC002869 TaxID=3161032 RepID=UPI00398CF2CC